MAVVAPMGGEVLGIECEVGWVGRLLAEALEGARCAPSDAAPSVEIVVERCRQAFPTAGWTGLTRDAVCRDGAVVVRDVCTSGFDVLARPCGDRLRMTYRWRPPQRTRAASLALRSRFHLLARAAILQYPAMWWAGRRGAAPLHAPAFARQRDALLLAGASGVGKTTLVTLAVAAGAVATGDNLVMGDGHTAWGVVEPVRGEGGSGRRMAHGRRETALSNRVGALVPDRLVVVRRADPGHGGDISRCEPAVACRELVTSTYMAGELRRYWPLASLLAAGTGLGPAVPPVEAVARRFSERVPCFRAALPPPSAAVLDELVRETRPLPADAPVDAASGSRAEGVGHAVTAGAEGW
jgi:hypothetical protein